MPSLTCVILGAGRSSRMGFDKLTTPLTGGSTLLDIAARACAGYPAVLVTSAATAQRLALTDALRIIGNDEPDRGMTHSLRLADTLIEASHAIATIPADMPLIDAALLSLLAHASPYADVCFPENVEGRRGHPVIFSPRARRMLPELDEGDTLRTLRDDPRLTHHAVLVNDRRPFADVDDPETFASFT
ncbi:MAG: nucleotidyltransferase family protein [Vulcanimicrobiaceae bacterium]